jgi:hypothetical protein
MDSGSDMRPRRAGLEGFQEGGVGGGEDLHTLESGRSVR